MAEEVKERTLEETSTWAVAVVCFVILVISIFIEHLIHLVGKWLTKKRKKALYEALEKIKAELMLLGFISLLLTVGQDLISGICISKSVAATWLPCDKSGEETSSDDHEGRKLNEFLGSGFGARRSLATKGYDKCAEKGQVAFVTAYGIHQLHIFIFVLAVSHVLYCIATLALGRTKMRKWKGWEEETSTLEYKYQNDPERFRFARDTSFGRRHLHAWSKSTVSLWIVCFFRQFFGSVTKTDYLTLRHGFIMAHLAPDNERVFDFRKYISRSLEEDFKVVVAISPIIWFSAVLFLLSNTYGIYSYLWLPFIPLIIILLVGAKLQVIITKMGVRILETGDVVKGAPLVKPGDDLFWFGNPRFMLFLIHFVLFQNAFQLAFFAWSTYEFTIHSCFHKRTEDIAIRISMGVIIQILCSYVTLPLYALVTQMGTNMKPTIFNERVAAALRHWHKTAKKNYKTGNRVSEANTPFSSRPATPTHGMSPVHLLRNYRSSTADSLNASPRNPAFENYDYFNNEDQTPSRSNRGNNGSDDEGMQFHEPTSAPQPASSGASQEISLNMSEFSFGK
ncbi:MLO-like protein 6 [Ziziphus jujuba]|uniref:MLO-like protein n=1 Tax=Ziziphus jujuba TaxID=326968 RepID=A0ABM3IDC3_ZIZJJ|nr:MLO-like protein 6 [Ziziphus jujuba]